jgi:hypothetical protein
VGTRTGLDEVEKILAPARLELRPLCHPTRSSKPLYRLSYLGFYFEHGSEGKNPKAPSWNCRIVLLQPQLQHVKVQQNLGELLMNSKI